MKPSITKATVNRAAEILIKQKLIVAKRGAGSVVVNNSSAHNIAYVAPDWLMRYRVERMLECKLED